MNANEREQLVDARYVTIDLEVNRLRDFAHCHGLSGWQVQAIIDAGLRAMQLCVIHFNGTDEQRGLLGIRKTSPTPPDARR